VCALNIIPDPGLELFPVDQPEDQCQEKADQQTGCQREEKSDVFSPEIEIPRQPADPGDFSRQQKQKPDTRQDQAKNY